MIPNRDIIGCQMLCKPPTFILVANTVQEPGFESWTTLTRMIMFDHAGSLSTSQVSAFYEKHAGKIHLLRVTSMVVKMFW